MFKDLNNLLNFSANQLPEATHYHIADQSGCSGGFIVHHFVSLFLQNGGAVVLACLSQSEYQYEVVARKLGYNLNVARSEGRLVTIDCLGPLSIGQSILSGSNPSRKQLLVEPGHDGELTNEKVTGSQLIFKAVQAAVEQIREKQPMARLCVVLDDISPLLYLGIPANAIADLVQYCAAMCVTKEKGCLVTLSRVESDNEDPDLSLLYHIAQFGADFLLRVKGLASGFSLSVHGQMDVWQRGADKTERVHFKATDSGVALTLLGSVPAAL